MTICTFAPNGINFFWRKFKKQHIKIFSFLPRQLNQEHKANVLLKKITVNHQLILMNKNYLKNLTNLRWKIGVAPHGRQMLCTKTFGSYPENTASNFLPECIPTRISQ